MDNNFGKKNYGKQQNPKQKRIFQGSNKESFTDYRCCSITEQSCDCKSSGGRVHGMQWPLPKNLHSNMRFQL